MLACGESCWGAGRSRSSSSSSMLAVNSSTIVVFFTIPSASSIIVLMIFCFEGGALEGVDKTGCFGGRTDGRIAGEAGGEANTDTGADSAARFSMGVEMAASGGCRIPPITPYSAPANAFVATPPPPLPPFLTFLLFVSMKCPLPIFSLVRVVDDVSISSF